MEKWPVDPSSSHVDDSTIVAMSKETFEAESNPPPIETARPPCPDGGLQAWLTVFGAFLALFCTFGQLNSFGTFQTWYAEHQLRDLPPSTIAWIGSLQLWIFFFSVSPRFRSSKYPYSCRFVLGRLYWSNIRRPRTTSCHDPWDYRARLQHYDD